MGSSGRKKVCSIILVEEPISIRMRFRELLLGSWGCLLFQRLLLFLFRPPSRALLPEVVDILWNMRIACGEATFFRWMETVAIIPTGSKICAQVFAENAGFPRNAKVRARAREDLASPKNHNKSKFKKILKALCGGKLSDAS